MWQCKNKSRWWYSLVPILCICIMCYGAIAYSYSFCYVEVWTHLGMKAAAIGMTCLHLIIVILLWIIWAQIIMMGPGRQPRVAPFMILPEMADAGERAKEGAATSVLPPDVYQCDTQGYPVWCSVCQSLKGLRTHHSVHLGFCVPRLDHYCVWLGTVIGRRNYRLFNQFLMCFLMHALIIFVSVVSLQRRIASSARMRGEREDPNVLVVLSLSCLVLLMVGALFISFLNYMANNQTTIEKLYTPKRQPRTMCFCVYNPADQYRYVVKSLPHENWNMWDKGSAYANYKDFLGSSIWRWFIPIGSNIPEFQTSAWEDDYNAILGPYKEELGSHYRDILMQRIEQGKYVTRLRVYGDKFREGL
ncbi:ABR203Wp [Eremothecium gossypii ATCC 10895]|uniref:Palmitoyltransferase PFA5 n=1 Tax=Eremothecium gossypii (strain ATCC 10895 / CBS 109.51 / FGSC 9923 / NRRL Y-1056) TaxID=284811 RepID=PFA5_EREGS|nr:ABR203Wp [Eremothecium gossypii ATCC 10895]Q75D19.2 RecName: Full=Palmitoyltransferase PFA5; AltName: Full=Protein fatty acyltransferase 5 [Eremothecium gossypii ATCC 10895]AAS50976.2 ABR203Wp [Eremothecium gossypii ATCC 10895]